MNIGQTHYFLGDYDISINYITRGWFYAKKNNFLLAETDFFQTL